MRHLDLHSFLATEMSICAGRTYRQLKNVHRAHILTEMIDRTANLLGALGLAVADRIEETARDIINHAGETPAALVVIGYGLGPTNDRLRRILGLSHPGTVRLVDRLVADGLVQRQSGADKRSIALFLTERGHATRRALLKRRLAAIRPLLEPLTASQKHALDEILHTVLEAMPQSDLDRCRLCRMCDDKVCSDCPIPAAFRT
ncbi:MAG: MarR family transcriptional regulator [Pseudomonadota bacterium]